MIRFYILLIALFVLASSCQRSQFATTTRHIQNGRVSYVNNYHKERSKTAKIKSHKSQLKETDAPNSVNVPDRIGAQKIPEPGTIIDCKKRPAMYFKNSQ